MISDMPMSVWIIAVLLFALAWANGANDVSKGVATLVGSGACTGKRAVYWGTLWSMAGGMAAAVVEPCGHLPWTLCQCQRR
jgi:PiT family inorganic phosphate transporter